MPEPCKGRSAPAAAAVTHPQEREYPSGQKLLLEKDLAAGADQAPQTVLAAKEQQSRLFRALSWPLSLYLILSFPVSLPALLSTHLSSLSQSSLAFLSKRSAGNFATGLGVKSR